MPAPPPQRVLRCSLAPQTPTQPRLSRRGLQLLTQFRALRPIIFIGGRHQQGQIVSHRIYGQMNLAALASFAALVARSRTAFRGGLERSRSQHDSPRGWFSLHRESQAFPQILHPGFQHLRTFLSLHWLADHIKRRKIVGQKSPGTSAAGEIA